MDISAGSLPFEGGDLPDGTVPVAAVTCVKVMYPDGEMAYLVRASESLTLVEGLGMLNHGRLVFEAAIMSNDQ